jgi:hypothetical protein
MGGILDNSSFVPAGSTVERMHLAQVENELARARDDLRELGRLLREYLQHKSSDGRPERQVLRHELERLLDELDL